MMRGRIVPWVTAMLFGLFLVGRGWLLAGGKVFASYDTYSYAYRGDPAWDRGALVSFTGHAPRLWGVPTFFVLFSDDHSRAVGQWAVGTLAWALLAWSLSRMFSHPGARLAALGATLLIGLTRVVASWDFAILSESLSISLGAITLALYLWWVRTRAVWALALTVAVAVWWTYTRVDMVVMVFPLCAALAWYAWKKRFRDPALAGTLVLAFALVFSYGVAGPQSMETQRQWTSDPAMSHARGLLVYRLRISVFPDPEVKQLFEREFGMPKCAAAEDLVQKPGWAVDQFDAAIKSCPELQAWTEHNLTGLWTRYATTDPVLFARQIGQLTSSSLTGAAYAQTPSVVPGIVEKTAFPHRWTLPLSLVALGISLLLGFQAGARRKHPHLVAAAAVIAAFSFVSVVLTVIVSSGEVWRFGIQEAIAIRVCIVMLLAAALDARLTSRR